MTRIGLIAAVFASLAALALGPTVEQASAQVIRSGPSSCKAVALTFDLCPVRKGPGYDAALIQSLIDKNIPATFFLSGRWMAAHEEEVKALLAVPFFELGTHGHVHAHLPLLDEARQRAEIQDAVALFESRYGRRPLLFRPPYGEYDDRTVEIVRALGLQFILWSVVSGDPDPSLSKAKIVERLKATVGRGSVVVFHANGKGTHTKDAVEELYRDLLLPKGLQPVTVSTLLDQCAGEHHRHDVSLH